MNAYSLPPLLAAAVNILLIFVILSVYVDYRKRRVVLSYILWNLSMALWNIGFFALYTATDIHLAYRFNHLLIVGTMFIFPTTYHFIRDFTGQKTRVNRYLLYLAYSLSFLFLYFHFKLDILSVRLQLYPWGYYPLAYAGDIIYSLAFFGYVTYSQVLLYRLMKTSNGQKRDQCRYIFWGTVIGYAGAVTNFLPPFGIDVYPVGNVTTILYTIAVAYALVTVKMINLHYLLRRTATEIFALAFLIFMSLIIVYPLLLLNPGMSTGALIALVMLSTLIAARLFHAKMAALFVSRVFFRNDQFVHDIHEKAGRIRNILTKKQLAEEVVKTIMTSFRVHKSLVRVIEKDAVLSGRGECGEDGAVSLGIASLD
ncbi:MAG: histidine kinase N-terminal 7TM domain-containing protein, partial [Endomicrobiales bacterium]